MRFHLTMAALLGALLMPGCIAYEIRDEMRTANFRLSQLETQLEELQRTNQRLELVREQLRILEGIQLSLSNLDNHLAVINNTISSMNSVFSMLDFSSEEEVDPNDPNAQGVAAEGVGGNEGAEEAVGERLEGGAQKEAPGLRIRLKKPPAEEGAPREEKPSGSEGETPAPRSEI